MPALGREGGMWHLVFNAYADPALVRETRTSVKNSDIRQVTSLGKAESGAVQQAHGIQDLKAVWKEGHSRHRGQLEQKKRLLYQRWFRQ